MPIKPIRRQPMLPHAPCYRANVKRPCWGCDERAYPVWIRRNTSQTLCDACYFKSKGNE
jgi:hypothetical protein